jgi:hypothetical protein
MNGPYMGWILSYRRTAVCTAVQLYVRQIRSSPSPYGPGLLGHYSVARILVLLCLQHSRAESHPFQLYRQALPLPPRTPHRAFPARRQVLVGDQPESLPRDGPTELDTTQPSQDHLQQSLSLYRTAITEPRNMHVCQSPAAITSPMAPHARVSSRERVASRGSFRLERSSSGSGVWQEAWLRFLDTHSDKLPSLASWGSFGGHTEGSPAAAAAAVAAVAAHGVASGDAGHGAAGSSLATKQQPSRTSAGPPTFADSPATRAAAGGEGGARGGGRKRKAPESAAAPPPQCQKMAAVPPQPPPQPQPQPPQPPSQQAVARFGTSAAEVFPSELEIPAVAPCKSPLMMTLPGTKQLVKVDVAKLRGSYPEAGGAACRITLDEDLFDDDAVLYKVDLRGGRVNWVTRKKLQTVLRNRRSAAACREVCERFLRTPFLCAACLLDGRFRVGFGTVGYTV